MLLERYKFLCKAIPKYENRKPYRGRRFYIDIENGNVEGINWFTTHDGYKRCSLCCDNVKKQFYIHEIIAFKGGLDIVGKTINHIDGNKENNSISNLEAISIKDNKAHAKKNGLVATGSKNGNSVLTEHQVITIKKLASKGGTSSDIAKVMELNYYTVYNVVNGDTWNHVKI